MLGVDEGRNTTPALHLSDGMEGERRFAGALRAIDLDHTALGIPATQGKIKSEGTGGDGFNPHPGGVSKAHD